MLEKLTMDFRNNLTAPYPSYML